MFLERPQICCTCSCVFLERPQICCTCFCGVSHSPYAYPTGSTVSRKDSDLLHMFLCVRERPQICCICSCLFTGWRRCIECLKSQVSFRKRATNHKALLRRMTSKDKASYGSSSTGIERPQICYTCSCVFLERPQICYTCSCACRTCPLWRGGGLGSRPKKMYGERLGDGVEYHLMKPTPRR